MKAAVVLLVAGLVLAGCGGARPEAPVQPPRADSGPGRIVQDVTLESVEARGPLRLELHALPSPELRVIRIVAPEGLEVELVMPDIEADLVPNGTGYGAALGLERLGDPVACAPGEPAVMDPFAFSYGPLVAPAGEVLLYLWNNAFNGTLSVDLNGALQESDPRVVHVNGTSSGWVRGGFVARNGPSGEAWSHTFTPPGPGFAFTRFQAATSLLSIGPWSMQDELRQGAVCSVREAHGDSTPLATGGLGGGATLNVTLAMTGEPLHWTASFTQSDDPLGQGQWTAFGSWLAYRGADA